MAKRTATVMSEAEIYAFGSRNESYRAAGEWFAGNDGVGPRKWFVLRGPCGRHEYLNDTTGALRRFGSLKSAVLAAATANGAIAA